MTNMSQKEETLRRIKKYGRYCRILDDLTDDLLHSETEDDSCITLERIAFLRGTLQAFIDEYASELSTSEVPQSKDAR
ncbi:hypothetical protein [Bifidobacterium ruminantium]|uniref:hypothetical protein n=1 Tax=Bifidobacterium ruminantium TaxID=78346 RepID=UPI0024923B72|nr:hypothetical protein [Bifidobacterium ruminantium]